MKRLLVTMMLGLLVTAAACKKKDETKVDDNAAKPTEQKTDQPTDQKADPKPAGDLTPGDYEAKNIEIMDKAIAAFSGSGGDCDKTAAAVNKFIDENLDQMKTLSAFEKAHADVKKQVEDKNKDKTKLFMDTVGGALEKCKDNKALQEAVKRLPTD